MPRDRNEFIAFVQLETLQKQDHTICIKWINKSEKKTYRAECTLAFWIMFAWSLTLMYLFQLSGLVTSFFLLKTEMLHITQK